MQIDLTKTRYEATALLASGAQLRLTPLCQSMGWEENKSEFATRLNLTLRDIEYQGRRLHALLPLCTRIFVYADQGQGYAEVFRGAVWEWEHSHVSSDPITLTAYDALYALQRTSDNRYYAKGKRTKAIVEDVCRAWDVELGEYQGPDMVHKKQVYKNKRVSDILKELLEDAHDMGGAKCFVRAREGKMDVLPMGANDQVFAFCANQHITQLNDCYSMTSLITRVVITGKEDRNGRPKVLATLNGQTQYGILQTFQNKGSASLAEAKKAAQKILDEQGKPQQTLTLSSPDIPTLRKGDRIYLDAADLAGYFYVLGVSHDAAGLSMAMEVEAVG